MGQRLPGVVMKTGCTRIRSRNHVFRRKQINYRVEAKMKRLHELLEIKYPLIQGGMANIATGEFAASCSNAGALGMIAAGGLSAAQVEEQIYIARSKTDKLFGVNLMLMNPDVDQIADLIAREGIHVVTTGAGNPGKYMEMWKEKDMKVIPVCASVYLAAHLVRAGADMIIAEGGESGGHVGEMTTMALVPQMVDALPVPVIAAGGIASGRQLAAAYALGACGAQIGTCLLVSEECPIHEEYKQALIKSRDNSTIVTGRSQNAPVRVLKNPMARRYLRLESQVADRDELEKLTLGSLRKAVYEGNWKEGSFMAGQVCGQLNTVRPVKKILEEIVQDADAVVRELAGTAW